VDSLQGLPSSTVLVLEILERHKVLADFRGAVLLTRPWHDREFAFKIAVKKAMKDRPQEAERVIMEELGQIHGMGVWHGVHPKKLTHAQRKAILRSSMFLKEKYTASGAFEKLKARLVAGGDRQDKTLYDDLSSPTAMTISVLTAASIAAKEGRKTATADIKGAFLNSSMEPTGVKVHMRLDKDMTKILVKIDPSFAQFVQDDGSSVVELDKALYGTVEAAKLWFDNIAGHLTVDLDFKVNPYDNCVFNKLGGAGHQITVVLHVDDMLITCVDDCEIDGLIKALEDSYQGVTAHRERVLDFIGMTFDFTAPGQVSVTMAKCVEDIVSGAISADSIILNGGELRVRHTPATDRLFDIRDEAPKLSKVDADFFHSYVAKMLYVAKRVRPDCLTAVSFLSTRVQAPDLDDLAKLRRLLGYLLGTKDRGIVLRIGESMSVSVFADASYGVHNQSGKSHTGCVIVVGDAGPVFVKSSKQKIVTKSSSEAELVAVSDSASQGIHLWNFMVAQGYTMPPLRLLQDNKSTIALLERGGPASQRSRHIDIKYFWVYERCKSGTVALSYLPTADMVANILTKPLQGAQFVKERQMLTNWE